MLNMLKKNYKLTMLLLMCGVILVSAVMFKVSSVGNLCNIDYPYMIFFKYAPILF